MGMQQRYIPRDTEKHFFKTIRERSGWLAERDLHAFYLMRNAGLRVGTLCALTVGDAQDALRTGTLTLRDEVCKRKNGYSVPVTKRIKLSLHTLLQVRKGLRVGMDTDAPLLVGRESGALGEHPLNTRTMQRRMRFWCATANIDLPMTPHWLRHALGQQIVRTSEAVNPLLAAKAALGHTNINSTTVYTKPTPDEIAAAMAGAQA